MRYSIQTPEYLLFVKIASLPYERQPFLVFSAPEVAKRFLEVTSIENGVVVPFDREPHVGEGRGMLLFRTEGEVEAYAASPSEFQLEKLLHSSLEED